MSGETPDVTVSIVNHGDPELLLDALKLLVPAHGFGGVSYEVMVLDNGSVEGRARVISERFPEVTVVAQPWCAGFAANHNRLLGAACSR